MSRCHKTEQGVKKIKDCRIPSTIEILMEMRSSCTLSNVLSSVVKDLIDQTDSSIQALVVQKSVIEKSVTNPCETLPNAADQDEMKFGRLKPNLSIQNSLERAHRLYLVLLCSGGNKAKIKKPVVTKLV